MIGVHLMMTLPEIDLGVVAPGSITAPAGHGKTEVVAASVSAHPESRFLVLTHTNAGVAALKGRLSKYSSAANAKVETISTFCLRLVRAFPSGIGWQETPQSVDHRAALAGANQILTRPTVLNALESSYDRILVDEYQDCTELQHRLIMSLATVIPVVVLGDPLQAIFGFDDEDPLVDWQLATSTFPTRGELLTPHRWSNTSPALGEWLRDIRTPLLGETTPVALNDQVAKVLRLDRPASQGSLYSLFKQNESTAVIVGNSAATASISKIAQAHAKTGAKEHEAVQQDSVLTLCEQLVHTASDAQRVLATVGFLKGVMTGVSQVKGQKSACDNLASRGNVGRSRSPFASSVAAFLDHPTPLLLGEVVSVLRTARECHVFRPEELSILSRSLKGCGDQWQRLPLIARDLVDQVSHVRKLHPGARVVGSTLRVKGLEFDHVILVSPAQIPSVEHLYVALSRASKRITITLGPNEDLGRFLRLANPFDR